MKCSNGKRFLRMAYYVTAPHKGHPVPAFTETEARILEDTTAAQRNTTVLTEVLYKVQLLLAKCSVSPAGKLAFIVSHNATAITRGGYSNMVQKRCFRDF